MVMVREVIADIFKEYDPGFHNAISSTPTWTYICVLLDLAYPNDEMELGLRKCRSD